MWIAGSLRGHGLDPHTPSWSGLMRTLYLVFIFLCRRVLTETGTQGYSLSTRDVYFAYSSDLEVRYLIPPGSSLPNAYIRLVWLGPREREITTLSMTLGRSSAALPVTCGVVEFPGLFAFQMFMQHDGLKLAETRFEVRWPVVHLSIPSEHTAQVDQFSISVRPETKCGGIVRKYMFWTELQYVGADRGSAVRNLVDPITVVKGHNFSISSRNATEVACDVVDQAGFYRAVLKSSYNTSMVIAKSNLMFVTWSDKYNLSSFYKSVFPCTKTLTLEYNQPLCPGRKDKIRVYKLVRTVQGSLAAPIELVYVMEMYAEKWGRALTLGCDTFDPDSVGYCFIYVSVSLTGAVREQRKHCLPTHEDAELVADGIWSSWSPWGQCSITCGNGKKSRFRMCNNPPPMNGGKFCVGDPVEWTACSSLCPELLSELTPLYSIKLDDRCACGCSMWNATGKIVATGRCTGLSVWKIRVKRDLRVKLSFVYLDFYKDMQWVQIRNGGSPDAELLAFSDGTNQLDDVFSTTNEMLVEFMTKTSTASSGLSVVLLKPTESIHIHGFIAYYNVLNNNVSVLAAPQLTPITRPAWENAVTIGGVVVCVLVVIGALLFVFYHRLQRRRLRKYRMAKTESPTSPVHSKGTSAQTPSTPDELDSPGQDMETPLTGELKRKEYHKASGKSRGSVSSTSSAGYKRLRTKTDVEMGTGSKPSSRAHTPLQSPYAANAATDDFKHDQNFFKGYRPRSPKVHPSSKTRQSSKSPTSPPTKHSILTKALVERRKDEGESRVVIGASSTPPTSKDNSASNSMEAGGGVDGSKKKEKSVESREGKDKPRDKVKGVSDKDPSGSVKHRDKDESKHKPSSKSSKKRTKSSGVSTPVKNCVEMEVKGITPCETSAKHTTTEFTTKKARRPTSLTESYDSDKATVGKSPTQRTKFKFAKKREPPKESRSTTATGVEERQKCLPRPDGQSPENIREERRVAPSVSTPRSVKSLRSNHTLSPTKSIRSANTPSDMAELEYDDFIEDDPLSYFEYDEMLKLRWHGVEKIGKPIKEEDSASVALNGVGDR